MPVSGTPVTDTLEELDQVRQERDDYLNQLRWTHTLLSIVLEEQGGIVELSKDEVDNYNFYASEIKVYDNDQTYGVAIEVTVDGEEV